MSSSKTRPARLGTVASWNWSTPMNLMLGYFLAAADGRRAEQEADRHDDVVVVLGELVDVRAVVRRGGRLDELDVGEAQVLLGALHAFPGGLVEASVVDFADVGDEADPQLLAARRRAAFGQPGSGGGSGRSSGYGGSGWPRARRPVWRPDSARRQRLDLLPRQRLDWPRRTGLPQPLDSRPGWRRARLGGSGRCGGRGERGAVGAACCAGWQAASTRAPADRTAAAKRDVDIVTEPPSGRVAELAEDITRTRGLSTDQQRRSQRFSSLPIRG